MHFCIYEEDTISIIFVGVRVRKKVGDSVTSYSMFPC